MSDRVGARSVSSYVEMGGTHPSGIVLHFDPCRETPDGLPASGLRRPADPAIWKRQPREPRQARQAFFAGKADSWCAERGFPSRSNGERRDHADALIMLRDTGGGRAQTERDRRDFARRHAALFPATAAQIDAAVPGKG